VWLCFFSDILLILFSCIAASLFNKLTYVLYDSTDSLTPERYLDPISRFRTTRARGRADLGTCDVCRNRPRLCVHVNQPDSVQSDLGRKNALPAAPLERSPVGLHVCQGLEWPFPSEIWTPAWHTVAWAQESAPEYLCHCADDGKVLTL